MLDPDGPRSWLSEPDAAEVAACIFWAYIWAEFASFDTEQERHENLERARAWEHWLRVRRAGL